VTKILTQQDEVLEIAEIGKPRHTYKWDLQDSLRRMDQELKGSTAVLNNCSYQGPQASRSQTSQTLPAIDIKEISSVGFYYNMYKKENEVFVTSLYKIDCLIKEAL
jgi:hypothetical protein